LQAFAFACFQQNPSIHDQVKQIMTAETHLQAGNLELAMADLQERVKSNPGDSKLRIFLFQLMAIRGQLDRAETQLELAGNLDAEAAAMVQVYKDVMNCEKHRLAVFAGQSRPLIFGEPEDWVALLVEAQQLFAKGEMDAFSKLNSEAFEKADARSGKINDEPFEWLADADQRFGPVFEIIFNNQYYWVPMNRVKSLKTEEPSDLRDLVWQPAEITWTNGGQVVGMIPSRYPNLAAAEDADLLARRTEWLPREGDVHEGVGQRLLASDQNDYAFLQVRSIEFDD
jgi:type VI secretion system protein ImpE